MAVPYTFGTATASIPLSNLDSNFATTITLGNTAIQLGNTVTTLNNMTLVNVTVSSGSVTLTNITATTANVTTANISGTTTLTNLTASTALALDASKNIASVTNTGTGNNVLATSPTITTPTISSLTSAAATALTLQSAGTTAVTVDTSQNVGIGTTSPGYRLDVGTTGVAGNIHTYGSITSGTLAGYSIRSIPRLTNDTGTFENTYIGCGASVGNIIFQQGNSFTTASNTERARIDSSGNLLVAKTTDTNTTVGCQLNAAGTAFFIQTSTGDGPLTQLTNISASTPNGYRFASFRFGAAATEIGTIAKSSASAVAYNTTSDYRLKEDIAPMTGALAKVAALKPVTYKWKSDGSDAEGFIAHELAEVCPQAVSGSKDAVDADGNPQYQGIDTSFLVATLTAALQEQQALITSLAARIAALETQ